MIYGGKATGSADEAISADTIAVCFCAAVQPGVAAMSVRSNTSGTPLSRLVAMTASVVGVLGRQRLDHSVGQQRIGAAGGALLNSEVLLSSVRNGRWV